MTTLLEILGLMEVNDADIRKDAEMMALARANNLFKPWSKKEFTTELFEVGYATYRAELKKLGYRVYDAMDYEHMVELPEKRHFIFDPFGKDYEHYFPRDLYREPQIILPGQPDKNLVSIVIGKRPIWIKKGEDKPIEGSVYIYIESGAAKIARIHAVKGNEQVIKPILYALIRGHIEILIPNNLVYSR